MKRMDEMDRNIQLRAEEWGYRVAMLALAVWTFYNCFQTLANGAKYSPLPGLIVCLAASVQSFSQMVIKRRMIDGDEEYREPNKPAWMFFAAIVITVLVLSVGTLLMIRV